MNNNYLPTFSSNSTVCNVCNTVCSAVRTTTTTTRMRQCQCTTATPGASSSFHATTRTTSRPGWILATEQTTRSLTWVKSWSTWICLVSIYRPVGVCTAKTFLVGRGRKCTITHQVVVSFTSSDKWLKVLRIGNTITQTQSWASPFSCSLWDYIRRH